MTKEMFIVKTIDGKKGSRPRDRTVHSQEITWLKISNQHSHID